MNTIVANLFLVHSLGLYDRVSWNFASWSISTEVYTYLLFAILLTRLSAVGTRTACLVAIVLLPAVLGALPRHTIEVALDYGLLRCAYGFAMGMLCWHAYTRLDAGGAAAKAPALAATVVEMVLVVAVVGFVGAAGRGPWSLLAPYVFGPTVLAFAFERGAVSRLLSSRPLVYIGMISYSIYMKWHRVVQRDYARYETPRRSGIRRRMEELTSPDSRVEGQSQLFPQLPSIPAGRPDGVGSKSGEGHGMGALVMKQEQFKVGTAFPERGQQVERVGAHAAK